jgi:hypothetical protein
MIISYELESELTARSTVLTQFWMREASLYAGNTIEMSFSGSAAFKAFILSLSNTKCPLVNKWFLNFQQKPWLRACRESAEKNKCFFTSL